MKENAIFFSFGFSTIFLSKQPYCSFSAFLEPPSPTDNVEIFEPSMDSSAVSPPLKINVEMGGGRG